MYLGEFNDKTCISIHAPSRERPGYFIFSSVHRNISIHAPSRERLKLMIGPFVAFIFQSTLPHGSDWLILPKSL